VAWVTPCTGIGCTATGATEDFTSLSQMRDDQFSRLARVDGMFGLWQKSAREAQTPEAAAELATTVRAALPQADDESVLVVAAIAGLLAAVAYADREFSPLERQRAREALQRVNGMTPEGVEAVCQVIQCHVLEIATTEVPHNCRTLREIADRELRREVLSLLLQLAAADERITAAETNVLRQITTSLGLTQADYNEMQAAYRDRLEVLMHS